MYLVFEMYQVPALTKGASTDAQSYGDSAYCAETTDKGASTKAQSYGT